ncbi:DUF5638 domain-containing protein [Legionella shakespearei]|uniref:DUF5638 domain-containing protein n=1 Tax=Legionella shakespearei DSM 23087 TaxID=1122169 RepID=A0A0W0YX65_9GAMM|nr:DUF5638 domain-containing protein [Legionella shakespearei]KTD61482.1 hypothetical protein Lsha_1239 [Legionella shakespearei DSM 23087]
MSLQNDFDKIDKKFAAFENFLVQPTDEQSQVLDLLTESLGAEDKNTIAKAAEELKKIRTFYQNRFEANTGVIAQAVILAEYDALYHNLYKITANEISAEEVLEEIENDTLLWEAGIIIKNILNVCAALLWLLPVAASLVIMPFIVPFLSINPFLGVSLLITCSAALIFGLYEALDNLSYITSLEPVEENLLVELSFFSKMNTLYKPDGMDAPESEDSDYDCERSYDIFAQV